MDSNLRYRSGFYGRIRPEFGALFGPTKSIRAGENLFALGFGFASAFSGIRRRLVAQQLQLNFHSSIGLVHEDVAYRQPTRQRWASVIVRGRLA
jgi:hypothetical protein